MAYLGEIRMFAGNFAPRSWSLCDGQVLPIANNQSLFSILGTRFGGDGRTSFALPDLRGRVPVHAGVGAGLSRRLEGQRFGHETITLEPGHLPPHSHALNIANAPADSDRPSAERMLGRTTSFVTPAQGSPLVELKAESLSSVGKGDPVDISQPSLCVNFIICVEGVFPPRS